MDKNNLAIYNYRDQIIETVRNNKVTVVEAPTGSGKTTQLPQILFNAGFVNRGRIGVTQPRRIAAYSVSRRIAYEMSVEPGRLVGYKVRFTDETSLHTQIKIMTDGILLEEIRFDPLLEKYEIIIVDEAHERSLNIDFILGLLKEVLKQRPDFKVIISSATINAKLFSNYFDGAPIISVYTKPYPIEVKHIPLEKEFDQQLILAKITEIVASLEKDKIAGDILIFLHGEAAIKECCDNLNQLNRLLNNKLIVLPLYAKLSTEDQNRVFDKFDGLRKIVIATNIAETSITIDGIIHVIDSGIARINYYNPRTLTSYLETKPISKASCDQRMGRAGRTAPGIVYRLFSEENYKLRDQYTKEEIYRTDLSEVVLRMADLGITHYYHFDFISPPTQGGIKSAIETLENIGALDEHGCLTDTGRKMVDFPLLPRLSRILLESLSKYPQVVNSVLIVISFLSAKSPFLYPNGEEIESRKAQRKLFVSGGDFLSWINLFKRYVSTGNKEKFCITYYLDYETMQEITNIHSQLKDMIIKKEYQLQDKYNIDQIILSICTGLKQYICHKEKTKGGTYSSMTEKGIRIHPSSYLYGEKPDWIVCGEIVNTGRTYARTATVIPQHLFKGQLVDFRKAMSKERVAISTRPKQIEINKDIEIKKEIKTIEEDNKIYILDKYFDIKTNNKNRLLEIPYNIIIQLKDRKQEININLLPKIEAVLLYKDNTIIVKDKLINIIKYFDRIDLDNGLNEKWPKNETLTYPNDWNRIFEFIKYIFKPTRVKKGSKSSGFLMLVSEGNSVYSYRIERDFFTALETSIEALDKIFDEEIVCWNSDEQKEIEGIYHKLYASSIKME